MWVIGMYFYFCVFYTHNFFNCFMQRLMCSCGGTRRYLPLYLVEQLQYTPFLSCSSTTWLPWSATFLFWPLQSCSYGPMCQPSSTSECHVVSIISYDYTCFRHWQTSLDTGLLLAYLKFNFQKICFFRLLLS